MKILFTHGHLIVDEHNEYMDGAILVEDDKIIKVFPHSNKIKETLEETEIIDLKGNICRPAYFDTHYINDSEGVSKYLLNVTNEEIVEDNRCLGYFIDNTNNYVLCNKYLDKLKGIVFDLNQNNERVLDLIKDKDIKVLLGKTNIDYDDINIEYDGIRNIFFDMKELNVHKPSLANAAFIDDKYVEFNIDIHESILKLLLKNISVSKLILISNSKSIHESVKYLRSIGVKHCDLLSYSCLNAYKLYNLNNHYGSLTKGKAADLLVLDDKYNIKFKYLKGELIYE